MKKLLKLFLTFALCLTFSLSVFMGCKPEEPTPEPEPEEPVPTVIVNDDQNDEVITVEDGKIYFDGEEGDVAVFPTSYALKTITKIVDAEDENTIYYENGAWKIEKNATKEKVSYNAKVYGENDQLIENAEIISAKKVISNEMDLKCLFGKADEKIDGYFIVSNNINYEGKVIIKPRGVTNWGYGSTFIGTFDGDGHTVRYRLIRGGLFGNLSGTVKNAEFRVKEITPANASGDSDTDFGKYAFLATYMSATAVVENVYAKYDVDFEPIMQHLLGSNLHRGLGLSSSNHKSKLKNVIVDLSRVAPITLESGINYSISIGGKAGHELGKAENTYVIWGRKEIYFQFPRPEATPIYGVASNEVGYTAPDGGELKVIEGTYRYDDWAAFASAVSKVGNFSITSESISWVE